MNPLLDGSHIALAKVRSALETQPHLTPQVIFDLAPSKAATANAGALVRGGQVRCLTTTRRADKFVVGALVHAKLAASQWYFVEACAGDVPDEWQTTCTCAAAKFVTPP